jgi:hypothetical protein
MGDQPEFEVTGFFCRPSLHSWQWEAAPRLTTLDKKRVK